MVGRKMTWEVAGVVVRVSWVALLVQWQSSILGTVESDVLAVVLSDKKKREGNFLWIPFVSALALP
jgi:hypothetical protein